MRNRDRLFLLLIIAVVVLLLPPALHSLQYRRVIRDLKVGDVTLAAIDADDGTPIEGFKVATTETGKAFLPVNLTFVGLGGGKTRFYWVGIDPLDVRISADGY